MVARRFYCVRCMRWYCESSRSDDSRLCYHCWRYVCEYGWERVFRFSDSLPVDFTWQGVLGRVV